MCEGPWVERRTVRPRQLVTLLTVLAVTAVTTGVPATSRLTGCTADVVWTGLAPRNSTMSTAS
ncbi:hypothetical protein OG226_02645 [Streptomyces sp. NBC_01261]|uniref:hypothetical protein n=1 Tax=Streptomyces sp. NBC_01261 TaxID=2903802 RepID=UPI002E2FDC18|nr:hypothetical protein [Streptomyces sp. NBC_01261]